jgi:leucyl-tRNA synthetase
MFGATFMVVAPEHPIVDEILNNKVGAIHESPVQKIKDYVENARKKSDLERTELTKEKTGVFSGLYAINPATGKEIPIWISDFVLPNYGTGAIMSVPAHDDRDKEFAKKFGLEIISVYSDEEKIINSDFLNGLEKDDAIKKMIDWLQEKGVGEAKSSYHLRDWIFSRQHYWGEPIPMIYCEEHGWQPVPETDLPIKLPEVENYEPTDTGESPLSLIPGWVDTVCPICREPAKRETDTMPNWAGSDWYFLRYIDPFNEKTFADFEKMKYWMPVDVYIGGDEHNTLHLLYSRFIYKFLYDLGKVPVDEPYFKRLSHGVILGPDGQRMSKSKGNVIVPEVVAEKYGVDVVRMYLMFIGPFDGTMAWNENTLMGVKRFLDRFVLFIKGQVDNQGGDESVSNQNVEVIINKLIKGVTEDIDSFKFNTAIAKSMEALNSLTALKENINLKSIQTLIKLIAPFAPYTAEELYSQLEKSDENYSSVHVSEWPKIDEKYLKEEKVTIAVAINGKVRGQIELDTDRQEEKEEILKMAKENDRVKPWLEGKIINKEIYVAGKMVNFVIN